MSHHHDRGLTRFHARSEPPLLSGPALTSVGPDWTHICGVPLSGV